MRDKKMDKLYSEFSKWLDEVLSEGIPAETAAAQLCLYEESIGEHTWAIQFTCSDCFDPEDSDWACYEVFTTGEELFIWDDDEKWEDAQRTAEELMKKYLDSGRYSLTLKALHGIGVGFADGDLELVYQNPNSLAPVKEYKHFDPNDRESKAQIDKLISEIALKMKEKNADEAE